MSIKYAGAALSVGVVLSILSGLLSPGNVLINPVDQTDFHEALRVIGEMPNLAHVMVFLGVIAMVLISFGAFCLFPLASRQGGLSGTLLQFGIILSIIEWSILIVGVEHATLRGSSDATRIERGCWVRRSDIFPGKRPHNSRRFDGRLFGICHHIPIRIDADGNRVSKPHPVDERIQNRGIPAHPVWRIRPDHLFRHDARARGRTRRLLGCLQPRPLNRLHRPIHHRHRDVPRRRGSNRGKLIEPTHIRSPFVESKGDECPPLFCEANRFPSPSLRGN